MIDLTGRKFGRLVVLELAGTMLYNGKTEKHRYVKFVWRCLCTCGNQALVSTRALTSKNNRSCGCLVVETLKKQKPSKTHGKTKTRIYRAWQGMITRTTNKNRSSWKYYKNIRVSRRWLRFENFYKDMSPHPGADYSLDRIDNSKGYFKENCRWTNRLIQANNTRKNITITHNGAKKTPAQWAKKLNIPQETIYHRIKTGKHGAEALSKTNKNTGKRLRVNRLY